MTGMVEIEIQTETVWMMDSRESLVSSFVLGNGFLLHAMD